MQTRSRTPSSFRGYSSKSDLLPPPQKRDNYLSSSLNSSQLPIQGSPEQLRQVLIGRCDSKLVSSTCHGLSLSSGKPCRRPLNKHIYQRSQALDFFCFQHQEQAIAIEGSLSECLNKKFNSESTLISKPQPVHYISSENINTTESKRKMFSKVKARPDMVSLASSNSDFSYRKALHDISGNSENFRGNKNRENRPSRIYYDQEPVTSGKTRCYPDLYETSFIQSSRNSKSTLKSLQSSIVNAFSSLSCFGRRRKYLEREPSVEHEEIRSSYWENKSDSDFEYNNHASEKESNYSGTCDAIKKDNDFKNTCHQGMSEHDKNVSQLHTLVCRRPPTAWSSTSSLTLRFPGPDGLGVTVDLSQWLNPRLSPETHSLLTRELLKAPTETDSPGYIYAYRISNREDLFSGFPGGYPASTVGALSTTSSTGMEKNLFKVGRTDNVQRRLYQWSKQCAYEPILVEHFPSPHASSDLNKPSQNKNPFNGRKALYAKKLERLIHIELGEVCSGREKIDQCLCGKEHREWFCVKTIAGPNPDMAWAYIRDVIVRWVWFSAIVWGEI